MAYADGEVDTRKLGTHLSAFEPDLSIMEHEENLAYRVAASVRSSSTTSRSLRPTRTSCLTCSWRFKKITGVCVCWSYRGQHPTFQAVVVSGASWMPCNFCLVNFVLCSVESHSKRCRFAEQLTESSTHGSECQLPRFEP